MKLNTRTSLLAGSGHLLRRRSFHSTSIPKRKVAILGATGEIGQPLSLLMELHPLVTTLSLYDIAGSPGGVAGDSTSIPKRKVAILGATGEIGQPLSLLMELHPLVTTISLYDIAGTPGGVAGDVSHINTPAVVAGYASEEQLCQALEGSDLVMYPRKPPSSSHDPRIDS